MFRSALARLCAALLSVCVVGSVASCADPVAPRVLVQTDAIAKSDLDGVWFYRQTVVDVPFTTGFTFIGEQGENELEKIRWDVQEDFLVARRAYEWVKNTERGEAGNQDAQGNYMGAPVAAFRIKSHFDIVRDYNPSTGEELDRVVENTERKWYERKFIRVDWSQNLVTNFQFLADFDHGGVSNIRQDPVPYYVSDPADPDHFRLERPAKDQPANYLEATQKITASPESVDFVDFANVPLCMLEYATEDCASQQIKIRNSFLRAGEHDYDPLAYDDHMMERFGYFTTDRATYNRQYGETDTGLRRFINRFNIWQHNLTEQGCTQDSECEGFGKSGVRCVKEALQSSLDVATGEVTGRCSLPYAVRNLENPKDPASKDLGPRPIVYFLDDKFPADLADAAQHLFDEYEETYAQVHKELTGRDPVARTFWMCPHNPVQKGDPAVCGAEGTHARIGDMRFNMLVWVDNPTNARLLGYGPGAHDPETGETISGNAFIYGAEVDEYAAQSRDVVRLVNGDLKPDRFIEGVDVKEWVASHSAGMRKEAHTQEEVDAAANGMQLSWLHALPKSPAVRKAPAKKVAEMVRARNQALAQGNLLGADPGLASRRLAALKGTDLERQLANGELLLARGFDPRSSSASLDLDKVAPLAFANPEVQKAMKRERRRLGAHGVDLASTFDDAILGYALAQKGKDPQEVWRKIRRAVFLSTAEHEVGHTLGLRHNFSGSFDAMNFPKTYWDLRTANGTKQPKPRYLEPESDAELAGVETHDGLKAGISEFQQSSIMDYGAKFNSDINGIGKYDRAAIKFGYGQLVEVFTDVKDAYSLGALQSSVTFGLPQPLMVDCKGDNWTSVHYTQLPQIVDLEKRADVEFSKIKNEVPKDTSCAYPDAVDRDPQGHLVVPYRFCSDEFEGAAMDCRMFDRGADVQEIAQNAIDSYRNYYFFNNFRRDRLGFNPETYMDRIFERYLDTLRTQMQFYVLFRGDYADILPGDGNSSNFWRSPTGWGSYTYAVKQGFDLLGEMLVTPEPGPYNLMVLPDGRHAYRPDPYADTSAFRLPLPQARYFATEWDYDSGYFWYEKVSHVGTFLDKVAALSQLTDPETYFLGKDQAADLRQYAINYWRLYPDQMTEVFAAALTDRWDRYAPVWTADGKLQPRPISEPIASLDRGSYAVDPQIGFSVQLWASTLGFALIPATWDQTFADSSRLFLEGNGQAIDPKKPTVKFSDPQSGKTYVAVSYKDAQGVEHGIAARMLSRAQELSDRVYDNNPASKANLQSYVQMLEVMRTLSVTFVDELH